MTRSQFIPDGAITPHHVDPVKYRREYNRYRRENELRYRITKSQHLKAHRERKRK
jgi:hypothetical protein